MDKRAIEKAFREQVGYWRDHAQSTVRHAPMPAVAKDNAWLQALGWLNLGLSGVAAFAPRIAAGAPVAIPAFIMTALSKTFAKDYGRYNKIRQIKALGAEANTIRNRLAEGFRVAELEFQGSDLERRLVAHLARLYQETPGALDRAQTRGLDTLTKEVLRQSQVITTCLDDIERWVRDQHFEACRRAYEVYLSISGESHLHGLTFIRPNTPVERFRSVGEMRDACIHRRRGLNPLREHRDCVDAIRAAVVTGDSSEEDQVFLLTHALAYRLIRHRDLGRMRDPMRGAWPVTHLEVVPLLERELDKYPMLINENETKRALKFGLEKVLAEGYGADSDVCLNPEQSQAV